LNLILQSRNQVNMHVLVMYDQYNDIILLQKK